MPFDRAELLGPWARPVVLRAGGAVKLGRSPSSDVVIEHPSVSRSHATLEWTSAGLVLEDLGSSNGTRLDGAAVLKDTPTPVPDGASIALGDVLLTVRMLAAEAPLTTRAGKFGSRAELRKLLVELERTSHAGTLELSCGQPKVLLGYERGQVIAARSDENEGFPVLDELMDGAWAHRGTYRISDSLELPRQPLRVRLSEVFLDEPANRPATKATQRLQKPSGF